MPDSYGVVQLAYDIPLGGQFSFTVDGVIQSNSFCLGLAGFVFDFGDDDNNVLSMGVSLTGISLSTANGRSTITGTVTGTFEDDNHHTGNVYTQVILIAALPGSYSQVTMANPPGFSSGGTSEQIPLTVESPTLTGLLSGFSMSYSGSDQSVNQIGATVTAYLNSGNVATLGGTCVLAESTKTKATSLSLYGALLADASSSPVFEIKAFRAKAGGATSVTFSNEVTMAQALLVGFNVQYSGNDDHKVQKMSVSYNNFFSPTGSNAGLQPDKKTFVFMDPAPFMQDDENNRQDNNLSYADYVVIGAVKTQS
ncbi:hypothetical protein ATI61_101364 [Archangium gephyra]|uniref:Uncharacterized protein n=1 Tax=Archangium gephyra TaxID=48 RepID=A0AAC8QBA7_9BACT|nr:hypothetical protein [Archangium gephyra]AKJ04552.1 Hypothetical protein AA314_06178 [Archangium gephyra]REG37380.1 hypothetical protein ATI61_101364 [Archangium gephyra]